MAMSGEDAKHLKTMIAFAKKEPISFAVCMGSKPDGAVVLMHKTRKPEALAREAKAAGQTVKVASGTIEVEGTKSRLTLTDKPPSGLAKHLKAFFKSVDLVLSVQLLDPSGQPLEDEADEAQSSEEGPGEVAAEPAAAPTLPEDQLAWQSDWAKAEPKVTAALSQEGPDTAKWRAVRDFTLGKAEAGQFAAAQKSLATLLTLIAQAAKAQPEAAAPASESTVDRADLIKRMAEAKTRLAGVEGPMGQKLMEGFTKAVELVRAGKLDVAADLLGKVETALERIAAAKPAPEAPKPEEPAAAPQDPRMARIGQAEAELRKQVTGATGGDAQSGLLALLDRVKAATASGEAEDALAGLKRVQDNLKLQAEVDRLAPLVARAASSGFVADANALTLLFNSVADAIPAPDIAKAQAALARVQDMISAGAAKGAPGADRKVSSDVRPYAEARVNWSLARNRLMAEIRKLEAGIAAALRGEGLDEDVQVDGSLTRFVDRLDARLEEVLARIVAAEEESERSRLKADARRIVADYRKELDSDFFRDVDDGNGFLTVAVASTARSALADLDQVLSA